MDNPFFHRLIDHRLGKPELVRNGRRIILGVGKPNGFNNRFNPSLDAAVAQPPFVVLNIPFDRALMVRQCFHPLFRNFKILRKFVTDSSTDVKFFIPYPA